MYKNMEKNKRRNDGKLRVLSGIRASHDSIHLGVYFGAVKGMIQLQNNPKYETFYMVADLHGITTRFDHKEMYKNKMGIAMDYLSAGIDYKKSTIFFQSDISAHAELAFYLSSEVSFYRLTHLTSYKDKVKQSPKNVTAALFNYPVLMAADILLYKAERVPIGLDQVYHLEVTREIAKKMNQKYDLDFPLPQRYIGLGGEDIVIPDLFLPGKKMSKTNPKGALFLTDSAKTIKNKISKISTSTAGGKKLPKEGGVHVLYALTKLFISPSRAARFEKEYEDGTVRYNDVKTELSVAIYGYLRKIQEKRRAYERNPKEVERIMMEGASKAKKVANKTLYEVKSAMGLSQRQFEKPSHGLHTI